LGYLIEFGEIGRATSLESTAVDSVSRWNKGFGLVNWADDWLDMYG